GHDHQSRTRTTARSWRASAAPTAERRGSRISLTIDLLPVFSPGIMRLSPGFDRSPSSVGWPARTIVAERGSGPERRRCKAAWNSAHSRGVIALFTVGTFVGTPRTFAYIPAHLGS